MIARFRRRVHVLVDSTGLQERHGARSRRSWRKLHLALDADSGEIIAHTLTDQDTGDVSQVEPLLDQIGGPIGQFTADGAYDGKPTYDTVINHARLSPSSFPLASTRPNRSTIDLPTKGTAYRRNQQRRPDEMAGLQPLRPTLAGRDRHRAIQVHHRATFAGTVASRSAD